MPLTSNVELTVKPTIIYYKFSKNASLKDETQNSAESKSDVNLNVELIF